jgi:hypothetical protein
MRLGELLFTQNTHLTGTIRSNRGVPNELKLPLETYQSCFIRKDKHLIVRYKDKKDVYLLTSKHHAGFFEKSRYMVGGKLQTLSKASSHRILQPKYGLRGCSRPRFRREITKTLPHKHIT